MTETFDFTVDVGTSGQTIFRVKTSQFGDGYSAVVKDGLNNRVGKWDVTISNVYANELAPVTAFLDARGGDESFYWTPPDGTKGLYRCVQYTVSPAEANLRSLTATFQECFAP